MINPESVEFMPLTKGYTAMVDADMYPILSRRKWSVQLNGPRAYAVRSDGPFGKQKHIYMHHQVLPLKDGFTVDHVNSNTPFLVLDERRINLRYATKLQQQFNRRKTNSGSSKHKGVYLKMGRRKWVANIKINGKTKYLGSFASQEDAGRAYDAAAEKLHGDFFRPNFPNGKVQNGL